MTTGIGCYLTISAASIFLISRFFYRNSTKEFRGGQWEPGTEKILPYPLKEISMRNIWLIIAIPAILFFSAVLAGAILLLATHWLPTIWTSSFNSNYFDTFFWDPATKDETNSWILFLLLFFSFLSYLVKRKILLIINQGEIFNKTKGREIVLSGDSIHISPIILAKNCENWRRDFLHKKLIRKLILNKEAYLEIPFHRIERLLKVELAPQVLGCGSRTLQSFLKIQLKNPEESVHIKYIDGPLIPESEDELIALLNKAVFAEDGAPLNCESSPQDKPVPEGAASQEAAGSSEIPAHRFRISTFGRPTDLEQTIDYRKMDKGLKRAAIFLAVASIYPAFVLIANMYRVQGMSTGDLIGFLGIPLALTMFVLALSWKSPKKLLILRPFGASITSKQLDKFILKNLRGYGHSFTLADKHIKEIKAPSKWLLLRYGPLYYLISKFGKRIFIKNEKHFELLRERLGSRFLLNLYWLTGSALNPIRTSDEWWKNCVKLLLNSCDAIIIDVSWVKSGTKWELMRIAEGDLKEMSVFVASEEKSGGARKILNEYWPGESCPPVYAYDDKGGLASRDGFIQEMRKVLSRPREQLSYPEKEKVPNFWTCVFFALIPVGGLFIALHTYDLIKGSRGRLQGVKRSIFFIIFNLILTLSLYAAVYVGTFHSTEPLDFANKVDEKNYYAEKCGSDAGTFCNKAGEIAQLPLKDYESAKKLYKRACDLGNTAGCGNLGALEEQAFKNLEQAEKYYKMACEMGDKAACFLLGNIEQEKHKNPGAARDYYKKSCAMGFPDGCNFWGLLEESVFKSTESARSAYKLGCDGDSASACNNIFFIDIGGNDPASAREYLEKACRLKLSAACFSLGNLVGGNSKNLEQARKYYEIACAGGHAKACSLLKKKNK